MNRNQNVQIGERRWRRKYSRQKYARVDHYLPTACQLSLISLSPRFAQGNVVMMIKTQSLRKYPNCAPHQDCFLPSTGYFRREGLLFEENRSERRRDQSIDVNGGENGEEERRLLLFSFGAVKSCRESESAYESKRRI